MAQRWVFTADGTAIQTKYIMRMWVDSKGSKENERHQVWCMVEGSSTPFVLGGFDEKGRAEDHIKDIIVGRTPPQDD